MPGWLPLESNPEVITTFAHRLGLPKEYAFHEVLGLEEELLAMVPQPVQAVMMLYPLSADKPDATGNSAELSRQQSVWFTKQTVPNACGTVGLLHALANARINLEQQSPLSKFLARTHSSTPHERARALEDDHLLEAAHAESAREGQTEAGSEDDDVDLHFVSFVEHNGRILELDGRKDAPLDQGLISERGLLKSAADILQARAEQSGSLNFNLVALAPCED